MEERNTRAGPAVLAEIARSNALQAMPWIVVVVVIATITCGLNMSAAAIAPTASTASEARTMIDRSSHWMIITIAGRDMTTGARMQVQCVIDGARVASDVLLVEMKDFSDVVSAVCDSAQSQS